MTALRVETATGRLEGRRADGVDRFLGIPFAQPPTGARRFLPPEPAAPWSGVREALEFGGAAPQNALDTGVLPGMEVGRQSEDCLYLNVYTPAADEGRRPVMVWIHGGAFVLGAGSQLIYDGAPLARSGGVVVVTINYRLGALGYLDLEPRFGAEFAGSANLGVLDQIAALAWVRENIARFGGDPGNVTIFGESAGGMSVGTLLGCPAARGLYQRAIPQSGAAQNAHDRETSVRVADFYLKALGAGDARALRDATIEQILAAQFQCALRVDELGALLAFQPCAGERTLPDLPLAAVRAGNAAGVPVLIGTTRDEWRLFEFLDPGHREMSDAGFLERAIARVGRDAAARLTDVYRKDAPGAAPADHFAAFETDRVFRVPAVRLADAQAQHGPVYGYEFAWPSPARRGALGSCHAIELPFVFGTLAAPGMAAFSGSGPDAERLSGVMMDTWAAFARSGDPANASLPAWPHHDPATRPTMILDREVHLEHAPRDRTLKAWGDCCRAGERSDPAAVPITAASGSPGR